MNKLLIGLLFASCLISCKNKHEDSTKAFLSVVDYLKGEVKKADSLPLHFTKIVMADSTSDTTTVTKEEFHKYAREFLDLPDISTVDKKDDYKETSDFDDMMNNVLLIYTAKNPEDEVRNETIMMPSDAEGNTQIKTILVTTVKNNKDSTVEKNMTWHIDKRFQIVTKTDKPNQPERINTVVISWE